MIKFKKARWYVCGVSGEAPPPPENCPPGELPPYFKGGGEVPPHQIGRGGELPPCQNLVGGYLPPHQICRGGELPPGVILVISYVVKTILTGNFTLSPYTFYPVTI